MADWTELMPDGVQNPIVVEIRRPIHQTGEGPHDHEVGELPHMDPWLSAELQRVWNDPEWNDSKSMILEELGADHLAILFLGQFEHWRAKTGGPGDRDRRPRPLGHDIYITVHLPPTVATTPEEEVRATRTLMEWAESSELGIILDRVVRGSRTAHISARGRGYYRIADLGHIAKRDEVPGQSRLILGLV